MRRRYRPVTIPTLTSALESYRVDELRALARLMSDGAPTRKAELVRALASSLAGPGLRSAHDRLDRLQRAAVAEALHAWDGEYRPDAFRAKYGREPKFGDADLFRMNRPSPLRIFLHPLEPGGPLRLPDDLRDALMEIVLVPAAAELATAEEPPETHDRPVRAYDAKARAWQTTFEPVPLEIRVMEVAACQDLTAVLALVDGGRVAVSDRKRQPTATSTRAVASVLQGGDFYTEAEERTRDRRRGPDRVGPIRSFAWPMLLQAGGLARCWGSKLRLTPAGRAAMAAEPASVLHELWRRWVSTNVLDELSRVEAIRGQSGNGRRGLTPASFRRDAIDEALSECPPGRWVAVDEFWRYMRASGHDFEVSSNLWDLYIAEKQYGSFGYDGYGKWEYLQGRYVLAVLFEYAASLGMIDVGYVPPAGARPDYHDLWGTEDLEYLSRYDGLIWFRLTALGAYCLGLTQSYEPSRPEPRRALAVMANLEVAALDGASVPPSDRLVLDRFAEPVSERVWRLDRDRILAAVEDGHAVGSLRELLEVRSDGALPQPVVRFLADIEERAGKLRDAGAARIIDCGDPALAARIAADPTARRICMPAGDRYVVVTAGKEGRRSGGSATCCRAPRRGSGWRRACCL